MRVRKRSWLVLSLVAIVTVCLGGIVIRKATQPSLHLRTCFHSYSGLKPDAMVRLAGVEIGRVRRITNGNEACPVDVQFELALTKEFSHLPRNATAQLETEGVLGPTYLAIVLPKTGGPAIQDQGELQSIETTAGLLSPETAKKIKKLVDDQIDGMTAKPRDFGSDPPEKQ